MNREEAVAIISATYPADSEYGSTAELGRYFLDQAKSEAIGWRSEPTEVLARYAELCLNESSQ